MSIEERAARIEELLGCNVVWIGDRLDLDRRQGNARAIEALRAIREAHVESARLLAELRKAGAR